nr:phage Gp37/Gp68 family protein [Methylobacterium sp. ZNC0032]
MAETAIEWTERSWNPIVGCAIVSPGCTNCYAMKMARRIELMGTAAHYDGLTQQTKAGAVWTGKLALAPEHVLLEPLRRRKPTTWFVNSMGDLFHEDVPHFWIDLAFAVMALTPQHTYQVLTKRAARMRAYLSDHFVRDRIAMAAIDIVNAHSEMKLASQKWFERRDGVDHLIMPWPLPNVWLGVSAEDQRRADERIPDLLATPAAVRFVSAEPLLGPINFRHFRCDETYSPDSDPHNDLDALTGEVSNLAVRHTERRAKLDWIIVGGESGPGARPMHPDWPRQIRDQCVAAGTAFFFKQWGEWQPRKWCRDGGTHALNSHPGHSFQKIQSHPDSIERVGAGPDWVALAKVGKNAAGRLLDGAEHNAMPEVR